MSTKPKPKKRTRQQLEREIVELKAMQPYSYAFATKEIDKAGTAHQTASAVVITLTGIGGADIINPVAIRDGLSKETIEAIKRDIARSYDIAVMFKP
jgi:hypothetical protein